MPEIAEVQSRQDRGDAGFGVAVYGWVPVAAVEAGPAVQAAVAAGQHVLVSVAVRCALSRSTRNGGSRMSPRSMSWPARRTPPTACHFRRDLAMREQKVLQNLDGPIGLRGAPASRDG